MSLEAAILSLDDKIINSVEIILLLTFLFYSSKLFISFLTDKREIKTLYKLLQEYKNQIKTHDYDTQLDIAYEYDLLCNTINNSSSKMQQLWKRFDRSLLKKREKEEFIIECYRDAEYFFNRETMMENINAKTFTSTADKLLLIGGLGSFIAIYFSVTNLDATQTETLLQALKAINDITALYIQELELLPRQIEHFYNSLYIIFDMIGTKFIASIIALILAMVFTYAHILFMSFLDKKVGMVQILVNQIFMKKTADANNS